VTRVFTDMEIWEELRRRVLTVESCVALQQVSFRLSRVGGTSTDAPNDLRIPKHLQSN